MLKLFTGKVYQKPGETSLMTNEGTVPILELIQFLKVQKSLPALTWDEKLAKAAKDHADDIGPQGITGHTGSDGSSMAQRIERYGQWKNTIGENISFGQKTGTDVLLQLMIDDGVSTRGHRTNIFNQAFQTVGISSHLHKVYNHSTVFDYAGGMGEQSSTSSSAPEGKLAPNSSSAPSSGDGQSALPPGCVKSSTSQQSVISGNKKITTITQNFTFSDGSTSQEIQTIEEQV